VPLYRQSQLELQDGQDGMSEEVAANDGDSGVREVALAEYSALRAEVERRTSIQWNVFALQMGSAGAIASLAIASRSSIGLLLLVPFSSYMLGSRYILHDFHIKLIHQYIQSDLSPRLQHELRWECWKTRAVAADTGADRWLTAAGWNFTHPTRLAFVGIAALSEVAAACAGIYLLKTGNPPWPAVAAYSVGVLLGVATTVVLHRSFRKARTEAPAAPGSNEHG
jgi:hypothetical protein